MLKAKSSENFLSLKICQIFTFQGPWRSGGVKSSDFYIAWIHVVWAILREDRLGEGESDLQGWARKQSESIGLP